MKLSRVSSIPVTLSAINKLVFIVGSNTLNLGFCCCGFAPTCQFAHLKAGSGYNGAVTAL